MYKQFIRIFYMYLNVVWYMSMFMYMYYVFIILYKYVQFCDFYLQEFDVFFCFCGWMVVMMDVGLYD